MTKTKEDKYQVIRDATLDDISRAYRFRAELAWQLIPNNNIFFVHIPKNAGTTFMKGVLGRRTGTHLTANQINSIDEYKNYKNILFSRDPFDRFVSVYLWRLRKDELVKSINIEDVIEMLDSKYINQPTELGFEKDPEKLDRMFLKQVTWMNENTEFIGRVETFKQGIVRLGELYRFVYPEHFSPRALDIELVLPDPAHLPLREGKCWDLPSHHNRAHPDGPQPEPTRKQLIKILKQSATLRNKFFDYYAEDYKKFGYTKPYEL